MIKTLSERIEREHSQYLRDSQRIEDRSGGFDANATYNGAPKLGGTVDFQTLVAGPATAATSSGGLGTSTGVNGVAKTTSWEDDVWGSILDGNDVSASRTRECLLTHPSLSYRRLLHHQEVSGRPFRSR